VAVTSPVWRDEKGAPRYLEGTIEDVTERRRAVEELEFRNVLLSTQQEASLDGILASDVRGKVVSMNSRFAEMWRIPREVVESRSDGAVLQSVLEMLVDPGEFLATVESLVERRDTLRNPFYGGE